MLWRFCCFLIQNMWKIKAMCSSETVLLTQYCRGGKIEKNEMGGACGMYGGGKRCAQGSGWET